MADVNGKRTSGGGFSNDSEFVRVTYDFDNDGGTAGALTLFEADGACVLKSFHAVVKTQCVGAGSTLDVGINGGDTDALLDDVDISALTAASLHSDPLVEGAPNAKSVPLYLADGAKIDMEIKTAAWTAGKIEYVFELMKA